MSNGYIVNTMADPTNVDFLLDQENSYLSQVNSQLIEANARLSASLHNLHGYIAEVQVENTKLLEDYRANIEILEKFAKQHTLLKTLFRTKIQENTSLQSDVNILEQTNKRLEQTLTNANAKLTSLTKENAELKRLNAKP
jgi:hypothetical protein